MESLGQSHRSATQNRRSLIPSALQPSKLWSRLQDGYSQWRDKRVAAVHAADLDAHGRPAARVRMRMRSRARHGQGFGLEAVEPRLLLSADLSYTAVADSDFTLRFDDGTEMVQLVDSADYLQVYSSADLASILGDDGQIDLTLDSAGYGVTLRLDTSLTSALGVSFINISGGTGTDDLTVTGDGASGKGLTVEAEQISVTGTLTADSLSFTALAQSDGTVPLATDYLGLYLVADSNALIDLSGATLDIAGAVELLATTDVDVIADPASFGNGSLALSGLAVLGSAEIKMHNTTLSAASLNAATTMDVVYQLDTSGQTPTDDGEDAAVTIVYLETVSGVTVSGNASLQVAGAVGLFANTNVNVSATADGGGADFGATMALTIVNLSTEAAVTGSAAIIGRNADDPDSVTVAATLGSSMTSSASSTAGGATNGDGSNRSQQRLQNPDGDVGTDDQVSTADGGLNFAGALALSFYESDTQARVDTGGNLRSANALAVHALATETVSTSANGSNTGDTADGVGVAVAFAKTDSHTRAVVGGSSLIHAAGGVDVDAELAGGDSFTVSAVSGAGAASELGVAGAVAIHVLDTAAVAEVTGTTTLTPGTNVVVSASNTTHASTTAAPNDSGVVSENGIGASVAVAAIDNSSTARLADGATLNGAGDLTLSATGNYTIDTLAAAGGSPTAHREAETAKAHRG